MNNLQKTKIFELALGKISEARFFKEFGVEIDSEGRIVDELLENAFAERDADGLEAALILGFRFGFSRESVPVLQRLAGEPWHNSHENIISALQEMPNISSLEALFQLAMSDFRLLYPDESDSIGMRCIYALVSIGGKDAVKYLKILEQSPRRAIAMLAQKALKALSK